MSEITELNPEAKIVVGLDIEATGQYIGKDRCFAVGVAVGTYNMKGEAVMIEKHLLVENISKAHPDETYLEMWTRCGFEQRCYDEFWSKYLELLTILLSKGTNVDIGLQFNEILVSLEARFPGRLVFVTDTVFYDPSWISYILSNSHCYAMNYKRSGGYGSSCYELDSYVAGLIGVNVVFANWRRDIAPFYEKIREHIPAGISNMHSPDIDAANIMYKFLIAQPLIKKTVQ